MPNFLAINMSKSIKLYNTNIRNVGSEYQKNPYFKKKLSNPK